MKNLGKTSKAFAVALVIASIFALTFSARPVKAAVTGNEMMFANPSAISRKDLLTGNTFTMNITVANMSQITVLACSLTWDPYYLNLTNVVGGGCLPGGVLLIGDRNYTEGWMTDLTYGVLGNQYDIPLGTFLICTFQIKHPGFSTVDVWGMSCWDNVLNEVLSGDTPYDGTVNIIEIRNWPIDYDGDLDVDFYVQTESNSTIATPVNFTIISQNEGHLFFNITGKTGSKGYTNATVNQNMLNASSLADWHTLVDNVETAKSIASNTTYTFVYVTYNHSDHSIMIIGNKVVPEFPSSALLFLMLAITAIMLVLIGKVHKKPWQAQLKR